MVQGGTSSATCCTLAAKYVMSNLFTGPGAEWTPIEIDRDAILDTLITMTDDERYELGASDWHFRQAAEREADQRRLRRFALDEARMWLALAEHEQNHSAASKYRFKIAALEMMDEADDLTAILRDEPVAEVQTTDDLRALIRSAE
ncbi:hypothetical protein HNO88_003730 [Novosphingobium chloroacetimidivorans]|uniref:Uncharacterized protein n=1 Tax=Novosphingobium chloroacetimidivorans TaxID=1428314 RepID=A0A7W7KCP4_9SPHN|nr:hypothetical protein [Novosphingobium chloroacetimidivorans]MBB4860387.1 hypothetical protein [Novosphingobium chloroacetimidivorans]